MSISGDDVRHIAALARVGVDDSRISSLVEQLNGILAHMDVLQSVPLPDDIHEDITAMPLRPDVLGATALHVSREQFAPAMRDGFFLVPRLSTHQAAGAAADEEEA